MKSGHALPPPHIQEDKLLAPGYVEALAARAGRDLRGSPGVSLRVADEETEAPERRCYPPSEGQGWDEITGAGRCREGHGQPQMAGSPSGLAHCSHSHVLPAAENSPHSVCGLGAGKLGAGPIALPLWTDKARRRDCDRYMSPPDTEWWIICFLPARSFLRAFLSRSPLQPYF